MEKALEGGESGELDAGGGGGGGSIEPKTLSLQ